MKKAIYTVITGDYDQIRQAPNYPGWEPVLFTDKVPDNSMGWDVRLIEPDKSICTRKLSRKYKILSHIYLSEYNLVCYIDANMKLVKEPPSHPIFFSHPSRSKIFFEARTIVDLKKDGAETVKEQIDNYKRVGFKDNQGLFSNGFFVRDHSPEINKLHEFWWENVKRFSYRDQLSLPFAVWKTGIRPKKTTAYYIAKRYITIGTHGKKEAISNKITVHHITPATSDKNFGYAINRLIEGLPDNDWICLRDIDTFPPYHEEFIKQVDTIANGNHNFALIGCMTNRLGLAYQLVPGMFDEKDISKHREVAKVLSERKTIKPLQRYQTIGGLFMLFSKNTWLRAGKFPEGGIEINGKFVDYYFSRAVNQFGRIGIAEGIYLYHNYRIEATNTRTATAHLKV